ncbi:creatininase family protein [Aureimonas jatrophae]|uniref:Creatinine amidohydrolase n=1 Tax=Aureimonas jatrophae TaxID=1166073 RepID=A0A1H0J6F2_9HYPH|nr:creatininase family protein [Aureimonas jatrophae]MBB3951573.1 creatinine amidohydrolase [Aureimonas jatrophae]SDO39234.1 creatinine amidohydrolase [Aureimonas jatrophae]
MPLRRHFEDNTSAELARLRDDLAAAVAILPVAAIEQHGAHLPIGTDALIGEAMGERMMALLPSDLAATLLPVQRIGASDEHLGFPGTLSLGSRAMSSLIEAIGTGLIASGFRRLAVISSHGGNSAAVDIAALALRRRGMLCATASWNRFGLPETGWPAHEISHGVHGGAVETALMLHLHPSLVRLDQVGECTSLQAELERGNRHLRAHGRLGFGWLAGDLNPIGTVGDARLATAEIGARIANHQASRCAEFVLEIARFDLSRLVQTDAPTPISRSEP